MRPNGYTDLERLDASDPRFQQLQQFIRDMWPVYSELTIRLIKKAGRRGAKHYSYQIQTYEHYCHNIKREHSGNHIWFHIDPQTHAIYQRCFDSDCKNYISKTSIKLSSRLITLLFPEQQQKVNHQKDIIQDTLHPSQKQVDDFDSLFEIDEFC